MRMLQPGSAAAIGVAAVVSITVCAGTGEVELGPKASNKIGKCVDCGAGGPVGGFLACVCACGEGAAVGVACACARNGDCSAMTASVAKTIATVSLENRGRQDRETIGSSTEYANNLNMEDTLRSRVHTIAQQFD